MKDFTKEFFLLAWGEDGYYETFSYGVGIKEVRKQCLYPFMFPFDTALEIGSGGGVFTEKMVGNFKKVIAVDVIPMPKKFEKYKDFKYIELADQSNDLPGIYDHSIDFCFCYNVFCHMSNKFLIEYLKSVHRVMKSKGNFVFMLSSFIHAREHLEEPNLYELGDLLPMGHFYQDYRTLDIIADKDSWQIESQNMIPEHRDIIVHLKKK